MKETENRVWVGMEKKIASFHEINNAKRMIFHDRDQFMRYLEQLLAEQYSFQ